MYFWTCGLRRTWVDKSLKSPVSEDPWTSNMVNGSKDYSNLSHSTFTIFIDPCEDTLGWKSLSVRDAKSEGCLIAHWLLMKSILFLTRAIYWNIFRWNYLGNEKLFPFFFLTFLNLDSIFNIFKKKMVPLALIFLNVRTPKNVVR